MRDYSASPDIAPVLGAGSRLSGNTSDGLLVGSLLTDGGIWPTVDVPILLDYLSVRAPLTIPAGTELRFEAGGSVDVHENDSISAIGTESAAIVFTSLDSRLGIGMGCILAAQTLPIIGLSM